MKKRMNRKMNKMEIKMLMNIFSLNGLCLYHYRRGSEKC